MTCDQLLLRNQYNYVEHASQQDSKNLIYIEIAEIILSNMRSRKGYKVLFEFGTVPYLVFTLNYRDLHGSVFV